MQRLIEILEIEVEIFEAVLSRRIRSFVLLMAAIVVPTVLVLIALRMIAASQVPGLEQGLHPVLPFFGLALMLKLLFLSIQTYLKDRPHFFGSDPARLHQEIP